MVEKPKYKFKKAYVTLHFIDENCYKPDNSTIRGTAELKSNTFPEVNPFSSFEKDLLNYQNQNNQPFTSKFIRIEKGVLLLFPETYTFSSEGKLHENATQRKEVKINVSISHTCFASSNKTIWHLTIKPHDNEFFTEYDIIKLSSFFGSAQEDSRVKDFIRFKTKENSDLFDAAGLIKELSNDQNDMDLRNSGTGIIQINEPARIDGSKIDLNELFKIFKNSQITEIQYIIKDFLKTLCGIILGIFDFERMDDDEIYDTILPIVNNDFSFMVLCRGTLFKISQIKDEKMETITDTIIMNPYLNTPSALLSHNEYILSTARNKLNEALNPNNKYNLKNLEQIQTNVNEMINLHYLEDIFQYPSEQTIVEKGNQQRGIWNTKKNIAKRMEELSELIEIKRENLSNKVDAFITSFLGLIAMVPLNSIFIDIETNKKYVGIYIGELMLAIFLYLYIRTNKRK